MIRIKVEYDAYNRRFQLRDREFGSVLEDGAIYELVVDIGTGDLDEDDSFISIDARLAHA